jgi:hypothetical protein
VWLYIYIYIHVYVYVCVCPFTLYICVCVSIYFLIYISFYTCIDIYIYPFLTSMSFLPLLKDSYSVLDWIFQSRTEIKGREENAPAEGIIYVCICVYVCCMRNVCTCVCVYPRVL